MFLPEVSMNIKHDPVDSSLCFVEFFHQKIGDENSAEKKEVVNAGEAIQDTLKSVRRQKLQ